ncbi:OLC1v1011806C1 [Oldenlandia corymbosa var. corymbosa]|uniref:OLC1v1011806C1 n=1 Tax=Oldenlandia corymbosa var. corymbosa TaxID=529605 RepID=A0AAV1DUH4_OLDCO|nr:OLC1v1011806C1 [Oldenlandia corymbosa var. corymbosa]
MGSCVSLHKGDSALKVRLDFGSQTADNPKNDPPPPPKVVAATDGVFKSHWSPPAALDFGSKEETFFDSQAWLESDCEDDFFSVNGDFTPSRGNTPVHNSFSVRTTPGRSNGQLLTTSRSSNSKTMPEPSPTTEKKKQRLSELFKDSLGDDEDGQQDENNQENESDKQHQKVGLISGPLKSGNSTPSVSHLNSGSSQGTASTATTKTLSYYVGSAQRTPNGSIKPPVERSGKSAAQCCLPRLRSFSEKKKR